MTRWTFLFGQWLKRDLAGRYRGSLLGTLWPVAQPLAQIAVFTLIFHGFLQVRWPVATEATGTASAQAAGGAWAYALNVYAGLAVFNFFSEVLGRAPSAVLAQPNLVTKVRFPLPLLPAVTVVLVVAGAVNGHLTWAVAWLPLWLLPVVLYGTALALLLASLGVYVRDIGQVMPALTSLLMFLTPIFYPMAAVPAGLRGLFELNPVAWAAEGLRGLLLQGQWLDVTVWSLHLMTSAAAAGFAAWAFMRLQKGFADVL
jgi:lipopolysaccharide transport system permease protein